MRIILRTACGARTTMAGNCDMCGVSLGSPRRAVDVAFATVGALAAVWIALGLLLDLELPMFAGFGAVVSLMTVRISHGAGPLYQLVATLATALGILLADAVLVLTVNTPPALAERCI